MRSHIRSRRHLVAHSTIMHMCCVMSGSRMRDAISSLAPLPTEKLCCVVARNASLPCYAAPHDLHTSAADPAFKPQLPTPPYSKLDPPSTPQLLPLSCCPIRLHSSAAVPFSHLNGQPHLHTSAADRAWLTHLSRNVSACCRGAAGRGQTPKDHHARIERGDR